MRQVSATGRRIGKRRAIADIWHHIAGSYAISDDTKPRVISLDFPPLPSDYGRPHQLIQNGIEENAVELCCVDAYVYQTRSWLPSLMYSHQKISL